MLQHVLHTQLILDNPHPEELAVHAGQRAKGSSVVLQLQNQGTERERNVRSDIRNTKHSKKLNLSIGALSVKTVLSLNSQSVQTWLLLKACLQYGVSKL